MKESILPEEGIQKIYEKKDVFENFGFVNQDSWTRDVGWLCCHSLPSNIQSIFPYKDLLKYNSYYLVLSQ